MHPCFLSQLKDSTLKTHGYSVFPLACFPLSLSFFSFLVYSPYPRTLFLNSKAGCQHAATNISSRNGLISSLQQTCTIVDVVASSMINWVVNANWLWLCLEMIIKKPNLLSACDLQYTTSLRSPIESKPSWATLRTIILTIIRTNENKNRPLLSQDQSYNNGKSD